MRLLDYVLDAGLAADQRSAQGLILRGDVLVNDRPVTSPAAEVREGASVRLRSGIAEGVSRGAGKLKPALERSGMDVAGRICLDLGVSTGGFTSVLLERGAARVYAVDVAYGVTALKLRSDPRVVLLERTNVRALSPALVPVPVMRVVGDLSFISWSAVLPAVVGLLGEGAEALLLVKPQFELAARGLDQLVPAGVVREPAALADCLAHLYNTWVDNRLVPRAVIPSALRGAKGNQEFFVHLVWQGEQGSRQSYGDMVQAAIEEAAR